MTVSTDPYALVVDDDALVRLNAQDILEVAGFRCLDASSGPEAVSLLDGQGPDVILLFSDIEMPGGMDGLALATHVAEAWPHIEIVLASGRVRPQPGELPERATFIPKPFSQQLVIDHLARILPDGKKPEPLKRAV